MDRFDDDTDLMTELRELRPTPRPEFTAELDERAAAGFPRRPKPSPGTNPVAALVERLREMSPARRLIPVLGAASVAVVVATVVVSTNGGSNSSTFVESGPAVSSDEAAGGGAEEAAEGGEAMSEEAEESSGAEEFEGSVEAESGAAIEEAPEEEAGGVQHAGELAPVAPQAAGGAAKKAAPSGGGPRSFSLRQRDIERSAYVVLGTKPGEVAAASAKVYTAIHAANGIVLHSSVQSGRKGATGATFELLIPSRKLDDTLAAFSQIAEVRERHDATNDITAPTVSAAEELADSNARIDSLLKELGDAETEEERESVEARLREERRHHAGIRASLDHLHERSSMSEVSLQIVTGKGAGIVALGGSGDGHWGVGDAAHDAGHILTVAAGVVLIGLAILAPIALIGFAIWLGNRFRVRRLRERTLG